MSRVVRSSLDVLSAGYTNNFNIGELMEKGVRFIGNGQAPVLLHWEKTLNDYIIPGKFDPTLYVLYLDSNTRLLILG